MTDDLVQKRLVLKKGRFRHKLSPREIEKRKADILNNLKILSLKDLRLIQVIAPYLYYLVEDIEIDILITSVIDDDIFKIKNRISEMILDKFKTNFDFKLDLFCVIWKKNSAAELSIFKKIAKAKHIFRNKLVHNLFFKAHQKIGKIKTEETNMLSSFKLTEKDIFNKIIDKLRKDNLEIERANTELFSLSEALKNTDLASLMTAASEIRRNTVAR